MPNLNQPEQQDPVKRLHQLLRQISSKHKDLHPIVLEIAWLVGRLSASNLPRQTKPRNRHRKLDGPGRPGSPKTYKRRRQGEEWCLVECRVRGGNPFTVSHRVLAAAAEAMERCPDLMSFDDLVKQSAERLSEELSPYLYRTILRFWLAEGLVQKIGSRYHPTDPHAFRDRVMEKFKKLSDFA